jgi:hypothetical protein
MRITDRSDGTFWNALGGLNNTRIGAGDTVYMSGQALGADHQETYFDLRLRWSGDLMTLFINGRVLRQMNTGSASHWFSPHRRYFFVLYVDSAPLSLYDEAEATPLRQVLAPMRGVE